MAYFLLYHVSICWCFLFRGYYSWCDYRRILDHFKRKGEDLYNILHWVFFHKMTKKIVPIINRSNSPIQLKHDRLQTRMCLAKAWNVLLLNEENFEEKIAVTDPRLVRLFKFIKPENSGKMLMTNLFNSKREIHSENMFGIYSCSNWKMKNSLSNHERNFQRSQIGHFYSFIFGKMYENMWSYVVIHRAMQNSSV